MARHPGGRPDVSAARSGRVFECVGYDTEKGDDAGRGEEIAEEAGEIAEEAGEIAEEAGEIAEERTAEERMEGEEEAEAGDEGITKEDLDFKTKE
mmetsp:Transcript_9404/g.17624  ORF Transcript_9404/g.17624 Transcript_9404/m.17624 type:complete len:95 (+) Transcript_9404:181-465(+)